MERVFILLISCAVSHSEKHSLTYFLTMSSGLQTVPEFVAVSMVDGVQVGYCDSNNKTSEPRQDWVKKLIKDDPEHLEWHIQYCRSIHLVSKEDIKIIKLHFNQTGGVHILQEMSGCDWDDDIKDGTGYDRYGYDGEDFASLDLKTPTWVYTEKAATFKNQWKRVNVEIDHKKKVLETICPEWLKMYLNYGNSYLKRKDLPSVSLLQKTPSSPFSCHATGFYPDRAVMFWRKDGEGLHKDVDHGEILPNHDGTFQMSVDLNISLVRLEDWTRYDCVLNHSGVEKNTVIRLDKAVIRTNWVPPSEFPAGAVVGVVVGLLLLAGCITGLFMWRKKGNGFNPANTSDSSSSSSVRQTSAPF